MKEREKPLRASDPGSPRVYKHSKMPQNNEANSVAEIQKVKAIELKKNRVIPDPPGVNKLDEKTSETYNPRR